MSRPKVLVVDDQTLFRQSLASLLLHHNVQVIGESSGGLEAIQMSDELMPDIILMDIRMPGCDGVEATRRIKRRLPHVQIVMLTVSELDEDLFSALKAGAGGYLLKTMDTEELLRAFESLAKGEAVISPTMAGKLFHEFTGVRERHPHEMEAAGTELSQRESEVLRLIGQGLSNREIANALSIAEGTVKVHCRNIMDKLHINNRVQAAIYAIKQGVVQIVDPFVKTAKR